MRIPAANLVGDVNDGWRLAKVTLGNERVSLSSGGVLWGTGPTALDLLDAVRAAGRRDRPDRCASAWPGSTSSTRCCELIRLRTLTARLKGEQPGPEASVRKILADEHGQHVMAWPGTSSGRGRWSRAATAWTGRPAGSAGARWTPT